MIFKFISFLIASIALLISYMLSSFPSRFLTDMLQQTVAGWRNCSFLSPWGALLSNDRVQRVPVFPVTFNRTWHGALLLFVPALCFCQRIWWTLHSSYQRHTTQSLLKKWDFMNSPLSIANTCSEGTKRPLIKGLKIRTNSKKSLYFFDFSRSESWDNYP